ncbi:MAG: hypothetical protein FJ348_02755 [Sphingomonadales bacterium]|nr:hypothetical protein [Sphingomonadales bacterium]
MNCPRFIVVFVALFAINFQLPAQQLTGIWKGYFITKDQNQYKVEVQIKEKGGKLTGVTYSYLDIRFYGKASMTGNADKKLGKVSMQEIKTVEVRSADSSETCIMNYQLSYSRSGQEEYLEGDYSATYEKNGTKTKKGQDCGGGIVFLRRVSSSDFNNKAEAMPPPVAKKIFYNEAPPAKQKSTTTTVSPVKKPVTVTKTVLPTKAGTANKPATAGKTLAKSVDKEEFAVTPSNENKVGEITNHAPKEASSPDKALPLPVDNDRQNELVKEIAISSKQLVISVYDNGEIDGDTVSVYLNGEVVLPKKRLGSTPLQLRISLSEEKDLQELTFVADNLGRIPPNTALMIVDTGQQQYRLQVLSTDKKNAVFRFRYQPAR